jgi:hypothetical protein
MCAHHREKVHHGLLFLCTQVIWKHLCAAPSDWRANCVQWTQSAPRTEFGQFVNRKQADAAALKLNSHFVPLELSGDEKVRRL